MLPKNYLHQKPLMRPIARTSDRQVQVSVSASVHSKPLLSKDLQCTGNPGSAKIRHISSEHVLPRQHLSRQKSFQATTRTIPRRSQLSPLLIRWQRADANSTSGQTKSYQRTKAILPQEIYRLPFCKDNEKTNR